MDITDIFEGFKPFNFEEGIPYVSVTKNGVTFNKAVIMKLDYPEYIQLLINENTKQIVVLPCTKDTLNATPFYKEKKNNVLSVRFNGRDFLSTLASMMEWNLDLEAFRIEGSLIKDRKAMLFDFKDAVMML